MFWDNPLPVVAGIVEHEGNVILIQNKGWPPDWWGLVTGFLERNETAEEGIRREVAEELGLEAKIQSFVGVYSFFQRNEFIVAYHLTAQGPSPRARNSTDTSPSPSQNCAPGPEPPAKPSPTGWGRGEDNVGGTFFGKKVPPTPPSKKLQLGWAKSTEPEDRLMPISPTRVEDFGEGEGAILLPKR